MLWGLYAPGTVARQSPQSAAPLDMATADPEAADQAPVELGGDIILWIAAGAGPYTAEYRAERISQRLQAIVRDRSLGDLQVRVTESDGASAIRVGSRLLMVVTPQDARVLGAPRTELAQQYAGDLEAAIRRERRLYSPATLMRSAAFAGLATLLLGAGLWLILRAMRVADRNLERWQTRRATLQVQDAEIVSTETLARAIGRILTGTRIALVLLALHVYLAYVLGLFPWTRPLSSRLSGYALGSLGTAAEAVVGYLPNLVFVLVIATLIHLAIRLIGFFFAQIGVGRTVFASFPAEWADPTFKIVRVLLIAFGLVVVFPYLPASDSPAFTGVSVFIGVLFSLASSSALSNMTAGIVLIYTGAFRLGDRVRVGDAYGDIVETSLLVTRVRTIKNEDITVPNSLVLGQPTTNYSRHADTLGLIVHTRVALGYDAPWRQVHDLLIEAALATPGVEAEPRPFVWQASLNDVHVSYEINAYTRQPRKLGSIYAALHAAIRDRFVAAGLELLAPQYTSLRDGNTVTIPAASRPPDYRAPAFRIVGDRLVEPDRLHTGGTPE